MRYSDRGMPYEDSAEYRAWEEAPSPKRGGKTVKTLLSVCMILLLLASLALLYIRQYTVTGASMEPTLMEGDRVFYVGFTKPDYGDLHIFDAGETYGLVIKRVVGLPGDVIQMTPDGHVIRNGQALDESYLLLDPYGNSATSEITGKTANSLCWAITARRPSIAEMCALGRFRSIPSEAWSRICYG
jgi:signal peptidase I